MRALLSLWCLVSITMHGNAQSTTVRRPDHGGGGDIQFERPAAGTPNAAPSEGFDVGFMRLPSRALGIGEHGALEVQISLHGNGVITADDALRVRGSCRQATIEFGTPQLSAPSFVHSATAFADQRVHEREILVTLPFEVVREGSVDFADVVISVDAELRDGASGAGQGLRRAAIAARVSLRAGNTVDIEARADDASPIVAAIPTATRVGAATAFEPTFRQPRATPAAAGSVRPPPVTTAEALPAVTESIESSGLLPWLFAMAGGTMIALLAWLVVWRTSASDPRAAAH